MKLISSIISVLALGMIGYTVGYLSGAVTGTAIYWRKAQKEHRAEQLLRDMDRNTAWELEDTE